MSTPLKPHARTQVFLLPDLGEGLTEAGLVQWLVSVGDTITTDQPIAEVETAKSIVELPSPFAGIVTALHGTAGDTIDVGAPVLEVADSLPSPAAPTAGPAQPEHEVYREEERAGSGNVLIGYGTTARPTMGRRRPSAASVSASRAPATASIPMPTAIRSAPSTPATPPPSRSADRRPVAVRSPLVRRLARDLGLDVHSIAATGTDGAVTRADVLRAAVENAVDTAVDTAVDAAAAHHDGSTAGGGTPGHPLAETVDGLGVLSRERMSPLRKAVSAKLSRSRSEIPEATVWVDVDATALWDLRSQMAPAGGKAPSVTALLARFVLLALEDYPVLASRLSESGDEIISFDGVNLGIAADTERGLLVPVVPRAHALTVAQLDTALRELTATARSGTMPPERLRGSTFTLNNYGGLGVDGSAAIINHPDVAILGIGRIIERPWVVEGAIVARRIVQLSLAFDHRVCDGGYAAGFLRRVTELIEHPLRAFGRV
ncbi:dihydrolipoamide acetyltransferase family protein [Microbacterium sp.]|uniref:dihydrolipoamide acetyltransferase family protein n=1 Tax=Microbacterium sp. TaxID=51671 RepID=UPI0026146C4E|nr:dihydrolipoamide acetyltransferase family protein [Microbacterium sp.]MCV0335546.1 2-oxo acid dehydrogenase subunit E2 [Microbacterium sp.]MCV0376958.1 2-oxo acid dehydrogenase subunit E2 [Microbacterium sp.]MCV0390564.1 2-oxo acid dehydrogenase subunit E2 [Microbacterium sp.]MCV0418299.1 2-oxo acid dehydrogenase subunit E2 [Microbacterium sp.]MCV0422033.1 2-oxo acid dehydrogenase subunit E2 [Microbacterium sp.]